MEEDLVESTSKYMDINSLLNTLFTDDKCKEPTIKEIFGSDQGFERVPFDYQDLMMFSFGSVDFSWIVYRNIRELYPDVNFATITLLNLYDEIVENTFEFNQRVKSQYLVVMIDIYSGDDIESEGDDLEHTAFVFIDLITLTAEYFDSEASIDNETLNNDYIQSFVESILRENIHEDIQMTRLSQVCQYGPQDMTGDLFCQTWAYQFLFIKLNLPEIPSKDIYKYFNSMPVSYLTSQLEQFMKCFYWKVTRPEERYFFLAIRLSNLSDTKKLITRPEIGILSPEKVESILDKVYNLIFDAMNQYKSTNDKNHLLRAYQICIVYVDIIRTNLKN